MRKMVIVLDPGHGGKFSGATVKLPSGDVVKEKALTLDAAILMRFFLEEAGHTVYMTREADIHLISNLDEDLLARAELANIMQADLFVSLHCNAYEDETVNGFEIYTSPGETESDRYATAMFNEVEVEFPLMKMRKDLVDGDPDKEARYKVLMSTSGPSVLVELGFITNPVDRDNLSRRSFMEAMAASLSRAISTYENA